MDCRKNASQTFGGRRRPGGPVFWLASHDSNIVKGQAIYVDGALTAVVQEGEPVRARALVVTPPETCASKNWTNPIRGVVRQKFGWSTAESAVQISTTGKAVA